ncbi:MAG: glycosyltransferase [archaeon]
MKVLTVTHYPYLPDGALRPAGIETFFAWHDKALSGAGVAHENFLVCRNHRQETFLASKKTHPPFTGEFRVYPSDYPVSFEHLLNIPLLRKRISKIFQDGKFDVAHANGEIYAMYRPKPLVTHVHGTLNYANLLSKGKGTPRHILSTLFSRKISQIAAKRSDIMIFNTKMLSDIYPFDVRKKTIPHAIDIASRCSPPPRKMRICSVARYIPLKNLDILINWFSFYVKKSRVPAELHLIGHGPLEQDLRRQAISEGIGEKVFFYSLPNPRAVRKTLRKMSAVVSIEPGGVGYNGLEAMAEGVPMIALSNDCGCSWGAPVKRFSSAEEFLWAVESLKPSDRARARKHVEKHHNSEKIFKMYISAYKEAIELGSR